ncbi:two-component sensor histidine kinase, partial [Mesorhizobium sp. M7A.T.Ca.TU.009.01.1.1]
MADLDTEQRGITQTMAARLWHSRWQLAAGVTAVVAVYALAGISAYVVLAALLLLLAAAILPATGARQSTGSGVAIEAIGLQRL